MTDLISHELVSSSVDALIALGMLVTMLVYSTGLAILPVTCLRCLLADNHIRDAG